MEVQMINGGGQKAELWCIHCVRENSPQVSSSILKQAPAVPADRQVSRRLLLFLKF